MSSPCQHIVLAKLCEVVQGREQLCISHTEQTVEINKLIKKKKKISSSCLKVNSGVTRDVLVLGSLHSRKKESMPMMC